MSGQSMGWGAKPIGQRQTLGQRSRVRDLLVMRSAVDDENPTLNTEDSGLDFDNPGGKAPKNPKPLDSERANFEDVPELMPKKIKEEVKQSELKKQQEKFLNLEIKATVVPKEEILDLTSFNLPAKINEKAE